MNAQRVKKPLAERTTQNPTFQNFNYQDYHHRLTSLQYAGSYWRCQKRPICRRSTPYVRTTPCSGGCIHPPSVLTFTPDFVVEACQNSALIFTGATARQLFLSPLNLKTLWTRCRVHSFGSQERYTIASQVSPNPHHSSRIPPPLPVSRQSVDVANPRPDPSHLLLKASTTPSKRNRRLLHRLSSWLQRKLRSPCP